MPTPLPTVSLTGAVAGTTGTIDLTKCAPTSHPRFTNTPATLQIYNESGAGLRLTGKNSGLAFDLPAGGWNNINVPAGETEIDYTVAYVLPVPNVSTLLMTYYAPGETAPQSASLGNSPINSLPVSIQSSSVANDGTVVDTEYIEASISGTKHVSQTTGGGLTLTQLAGVVFQINKSLGGSSQIFSAWNAPDKKQLQLTQDTNGTWHFFDQTDAVDLITMNSGGQTLDNNKILTDGNGNITMGNATLRSGTQESGHFSIAFSTPIVMGWSFWIRFRQGMSNIPSAITISNTTLVNITGSLTTPTITKDGFQVNCSVTAANTITDVIFDWVTVGN